MLVFLGRTNGPIRDGSFGKSGYHGFTFPMSFLTVCRTQLNRFVYRVAPAPRTSPDALDTVFSHKLQGQFSFTIAWPHHEYPRGSVLPAPFCSFVGEVLREPAVKVRRPSNVEFSSMQGKSVRVHFFSPFTFGSDPERENRCPRK